MEKVPARLDDHYLILWRVILEAYRAVGIEAGDAGPSDLFVPLSFYFGFGQVLLVSPITPMSSQCCSKINFKVILELLHDLVDLLVGMSSIIILSIGSCAVVTKQHMLVIDDVLIEFSLQEVACEVFSGCESDTDHLSILPHF